MTDKVYFIKNENGHIKIGHTTKRLSTRLSSLKTGNSGEITVLAVINAGLAEEADIHERFAHQRLNGEWFAETPELLSFIEELSAHSSANPESEKESEVDAFTKKARQWLFDILTWQSEKTGQTQRECQIKLSGELGVQDGTLRNLKLGRIAAIDVTLYDKLLQRKKQVMHEQITDLQNDLVKYRAALIKGSSVDLMRIETMVSSARHLMNRLR